MYRCDRCGKDITDSVVWSERDGEVVSMTAGYYKNWFDEDARVCDECMWKDPRYIKLYGRQTFTK